MAAGTGGRVATGGAAVATGGATGTGGATTTGGTTGTGGTSSTGGSSGGAVLFMDDFESGASKWTTTSPTTDWSVVTDGTRVFKEGAAFNSTPRIAWAGATTLMNMIVEARVKVLAYAGQSTSYHAGICARVRDTGTFYMAVLDSTGRVAIKKTTASASNTNLASVDGAIVTNTWYTVRFQVVGSTLTVFLNGVMKLTTTDSDIAAGGFGLATKNAQAEFDDVRVTAP